MLHPLYILLGLTPSTIWLIFYLRKDSHPEPKSKVLKVFFAGGLATLPAFLIERGTLSLINDNLGPLSYLIYTILIVGLSEELLKYIIVRESILKDPDFDEPVDAMIYMIIAALGFAGIENVILLSPLKSDLLLEALMITGFRFLGATFLHALCSALIGMALAISFFKTETRTELMVASIGLATLLHGLYNFSIIRIGNSARFVLPVAILIILTITVSWGFRGLTSRYKSTNECQ